MPTADSSSGALSLRGVVSAGLGVTLIGLVLSGNLGSRTSVIFSALGMISLLNGIRYFGGGTLLRTDVRWIFAVDLVATFSAGLFLSFASPVLSSAAVAVAFTLCVLSAKATRRSGPLLLLIMSIGLFMAFGVVRYYPIDIGNDSWGYLADVSAISQAGRIVPTSVFNIYYTPFPVTPLLTTQFLGPDLEAWTQSERQSKVERVSKGQGR